MKHRKITLPELNITWLDGNYSCGTIDTSLGTVEVYHENWYAQGEDAWDAINAIHLLWLEGNLTQETAFEHWIKLNF